MTLLAGFERIYVINLPHRADRRAEMAAQLARVGLTFDSPNVTLFKAIRPDDAGEFESIGARGCFMSHLEILRDARDLRSVLILEDDLDFVPDVGPLLDKARAALPPSWGVFYGGCVVNMDLRSAPLTRVPAKVRTETTHFVGFNGAVVGRVIGYLEAILARPRGHRDGGPMHVDGAYSRFREDNPDVETFVASPQLGFQRPSRTDIHALRWFDRTPLVRNAVQALRRARHARPRHGARD